MQGRGPADPGPPGTHNPGSHHWPGVRHTSAAAQAVRTAGPPSFPWWPQDPTGRAFQVCTARPLPERKLSNPHRCPEEGEASRGGGAAGASRSVSASPSGPAHGVLAHSSPERPAGAFINTYRRSQKGTSGHWCSVSGQNTESEEKEVSVLRVYTCGFRKSSNSRSRPVFLSLQ